MAPKRKRPARKRTAATTPTPSLTVSGKVRAYLADIETAWGAIARTANEEQERLGPSPTWAKQ
jgi:hypothetical protein